MYGGWRLGGVIGLFIGMIVGTYVVFLGQILAREHMWINGVRVKRTYSDVPPKVLRPENWAIFGGVFTLVLIIIIVISTIILAIAF